MAKIKLKYGENEIEIESRDFYIDNESIGEVIENITNHLEENKAKIVSDNKIKQAPTQVSQMRLRFLAEFIIPRSSSKRCLDNFPMYLGSIFQFSNQVFYAECLLLWTHEPL